MTFIIRRIYFVTLSTIILVACTQPESEPSGGGAAAASGPFIYLASGTAYAGLGITPAAASNTIARFELDGTFERVVRDYTSSPGDSPIAIIEYDADNLLVLVENTSGRRIETVAKDGSSYSTYLTNATALNAQVRAMVATSDGGQLVSKGTAIEKFNSAKTRVTQGANPYVNAPAAPCATSTTLTSKIAVGPSDVILMAHAAASPNNQINMIKSIGYAVAGDCITAVDGPSANHYPTSLLYHSSGRLLVGYGNNTGPVHQIYSYTIDATSITNPIQAYNNTSVLQGISEIAEMPNGNILVAAAAPAFNTIEQFTFDSVTGLLTRVGTTSLIGPSVFARSVTGILIAD